MRFKKQCRQIAGMIVDKLRDDRVMELPVILNSLERWIADVPFEPDERLLRCLVRSAPGEIDMHRDWVIELCKFLARGQPVSLGARFRQWKQRARRARKLWAFLWERCREPGHGAATDYVSWRLDIQAGILDARYRVAVGSQYKGFGALHVVNRQNALLLRNELLFWELWARLLRLRYGGK